ncbi:MAG TPA: PEP-CTERM sorting domain-containing protein [Acetobacteraceae bacterium]
MTSRIPARPKTIAAALIALGLTVSGHANAMEYLFGFSYDDGNESLTLNFASGGSAVLTTGDKQGWWSATMPNSAGNDDYFVGNPLADSSPQWLRNFFTFDISGLRGQTVTSATLTLTNFMSMSDSGQTSLQYTLYDVSTPAALLDAVGGPNAAIYDDLGSGVSYGSYSLPVTGLDLSTSQLALNANAVGDLNAAIAGRTPSFSIGGTLPSLAVPEPPSLLMLSIGLLAAAGLRRQQARPPAR